MRWVTAQRHAFPCLDDYERYYVKDTYAYVNLRFEAHNLVTDRTEIDPQPVREARRILEEIRDELTDWQRTDDGSNKCRDPELTKLWVKRVTGHLKLAEGMLR